MRILAIIIMIFPLFTFLQWRNRDELMAPLNVFTILYFIKIMIPTILYANTEIASGISVPYVRNSVLLDSDFIIYAILQTFGYYMVIFGMKSSINTKYRNIEHYNVKMEFNPKEQDYSHYLFWGIIFTLIGIVDFFLIMAKVGGVLYFFSHLQYRTIMLRNIDVLSWLLIFLHYGPLLIVYSLRGKGKKVGALLVVLILLCGFMCGMGGRKTMIVMLVEMAFIYHFTVKPIDIKKIIKPKYILLLLVVVVFFTVMVQFRTEGAMEQFLSNPIEFILGTRKVSNGIVGLLTKESYVGYFVTVIHYFKDNALWMGRSLLGIFTAFIPSSLFNGKPPVDDGMYLYSICQGRTDIMPLMPTSSLDTTSFPLETFGSMYANFGPIGVLVGMFLLGAIIRYSYRRMIRKGCRFVDVVIYTQILLSFELSTLRVFQTIEVLVMLTIILFFVDNMRVRLGRRR